MSGRCQCPVAPLKSVSLTPQETSSAKEHELSYILMGQGVTVTMSSWRLCLYTY